MLYLGTVTESLRCRDPLAMLSPDTRQAVPWPLSSGSSAVAAAAAAVANGWCQSPVHVHLPGGDLLVELDGDLRARLTGPAVEICRVELS